MPVMLPAIAAAELAHRLQMVLELYAPRFITNGTASLRNATGQPIGQYLLHLGYITSAQLSEALTIQQHLAVSGQRRDLGVLLMVRAKIAPQVFATLLVTQLVDRLLSADSAPPQRLGARLVSSGVITPVQLADALHTQMLLQQFGQTMYIGDILVRQLAVSREVLARYVSPPPAHFVQGKVLYTLRARISKHIMAATQTCTESFLVAS